MGMKSRNMATRFVVIEIIREIDAFGEEFEHPLAATLAVLLTLGGRHQPPIGRGFALAPAPSAGGTKRLIAPVAPGLLVFLVKVPAVIRGVAMLAPAVRTDELRSDGRAAAGVAVPGNPFALGVQVLAPGAPLLLL